MAAPPPDTPDQFVIELVEDVMTTYQYLFEATLTPADMINLTFRPTEATLAFYEGLPQECKIAISDDILDVYYVNEIYHHYVGLAKNPISGELKFFWRDENFISKQFNVGDIVHVGYFFHTRGNKYGFIVVGDDDGVDKDDPDEMARIGSAGMNGIGHAAAAA